MQRLLVGTILVVLGCVASSVSGDQQLRKPYPLKTFGAFDASVRPSWLLPTPPNLASCSYTCSGVAPGAITNIADLRPCDVKVVGAFGDSITAAFAAKGGLWEYRELSFFVGMGSNSTTTSTLLHDVNPSVVGGPSVGHFPEVAGAAHEPLEDILSAAQSEAKIADLLPGGRAPQIPYLLDELTTLQTDGYISIANDWKVLNIWIGANDLCEVCHNMTPGAHYSPQYYRTLLNETIASLQSNIPKTFVNLIPFFALSQVYNVTIPTHPNCDLVHDVFSECSCMYSKEQIDRDNMDKASAQYNEMMFDLAQWWTGKFADFAVVVQPGNIGFTIPSIEFLSTLDCFHPSAYAHELLGVGLWNQMLQPIAEKTSPWVLSQPPTCPSSDAKFYSS